MWELAGRDFKTSENLRRISGKPSRYQIGVVLYMGGQMRKDTSGRAAAISVNFVRKSWKIGSTTWVTEDEDEATDLAYEGFDCQPSVTEKYWQEVDFVREVPDEIL